MGKIIWLASYPKSGNTWMRAFLHNLLRAPKEGYDINKITDFTVSDSSTAFFKRVLTKPWQEWTIQEVADRRWDVQEMITKLHSDNVFVKTHNALVEYMGRPIIHMEMTAGAIYVLRNPLDVVVSLSHHYGVNMDEAVRIINDPTNGSVSRAELVYEIHSNWSSHVASWTQQQHAGLLTLRYEDMLQKPMQTFSKVTKFLGLNAPKDRIQHAIEMSSFKKLRDQEDQKGFRERSDKTDKFFREGKSGQWRDILTKSQINKIIEVNKDQMERFGYWPLPK